MSKVLIIGPNFYNFNRSVEAAFERLGWQAHVEAYDTPIHPFRGLMKWHHKFTLHRVALKDRQDRRYNQYISEKFEQVSPDLVFILNGEILSADTLDAFRRRAKVVLWMFDALSRYPKSKGHIDHVDALFCYDWQDVEWYRQQGKTAYFLPQAVDENLYFRTDAEKDIDILFVGLLYRYSRRIRLLKAVAKKFADRRIKIIGSYKPWYKNPIKWLFREKRHIYTNTNIPVSEVNAWYNRARVVLNIHHETQADGANPKVFEICGAGAYQICDANPFIEKLFPSGEVGLYHSEEELMALIDDALRSDKSENARRAQAIVLKEHTFLHRVGEMLDLVGANNY